MRWSGALTIMLLTIMQNRLSTIQQALNPGESE